MPIALGIILLIVIFVAYKLFVGGWLFRIILFFAGWFGIYYLLQGVDGCNNPAFTFGTNTTISWAAAIPTAICILALLTTRTSNE
jgi:hypothetical protein